jgi:hypothetical protein
MTTRWAIVSFRAGAEQWGKPIADFGRMTLDKEDAARESKRGRRSRNRDGNRNGDVARFACEIVDRACSWQYELRPRFRSPVPVFAPRAVSEMAAYRDLIRESFEKQPVRTVAGACERIFQLTGRRRGPSQVRKFVKDMGLKFLQVRPIPVPPKKTWPSISRPKRRFTTVN